MLLRRFLNVIWRVELLDLLLGHARELEYTALMLMMIVVHFYERRHREHDYHGWGDEARTAWSSTGVAACGGQEVYRSTQGWS